jgi:LacI family transcriptional regulator
MADQVTLQDVADRAGVHRSTVALALRDSPRIPAETRQRICTIAEQLGYRQNPLVAALMQSRRVGKLVKHVTLAFVTNYPTRDGWRAERCGRPDFLPGAVERARELGYKLEHFWLAEPGMTPARFCDILGARGIHGLIVGRLPPGQYTLELAWQRFSCVALGMTLRDPILHHATENHFDTVWQAMHQCQQRGYRRVGFVFSGANDSPRVGDRWLGGYLSFQQRLPAAERVPLCPKIPADETTFARWFRRERPDALVVTHSSQAFAWLKKIGQAAPRDIGLVELEMRPEFGCAGVYYDPNKVGALSVEMLISQMHRNETGVPADPHEVMLTGVWRDGRTLAVRQAVP